MFIVVSDAGAEAEVKAADISGEAVEWGEEFFTKTNVVRSK